MEVSIRRDAARNSDRTTVTGPPPPHLVTVITLRKSICYLILYCIIGQWFIVDVFCNICHRSGEEIEIFGNSMYVENCSLRNFYVFQFYVKRLTFCPTLFESALSSKSLERILKDQALHCVVFVIKKMYLRPCSDFKPALPIPQILKFGGIGEYGIQNVHKVPQTLY